MVHFPGVQWWTAVWDTPYELWDGMCEVIKARNQAPQQRPGVIRRG